MVKKVLLLMVSLLTLGTGAVQAQSKFTLKLGGAFPLGNYGDVSTLSNGRIESHALFAERISSKAGAGIGFNLGVQWKLASVSAVEGLDVVLSLDAFYNGPNDDVRDAMEEELIHQMEDYEYEYGLGSAIDHSFSISKYLNFPVMLGLNWGTGIAPNVGFFCEAAAGANLRIITDFSTEIETSGGTIDNEASFNSTVTFGFRVAAGVIFNDKYSLELGYYNLGAAKVKAENDRGQEFTLGKITPTLLTLRLGIAL